MRLIRFIKDSLAHGAFAGEQHGLDDELAARLVTRGRAVYVDIQPPPPPEAEDAEPAKPEAVPAKPEDAPAKVADAAPEPAAVKDDDEAEAETVEADAPEPSRGPGRFRKYR